MEPFKSVEIKLILLVDQNTKCYIDNAFLLSNFIHSDNEASFLFLSTQILPLNYLGRVHVFKIKHPIYCFAKNLSLFSVISSTKHLLSRCGT